MDGAAGAGAQREKDLEEKETPGPSPTLAHLEAAGDVRGPDAARRQLDDPLPLAGGEGAAVHEETPQLVHAAGPWGEARQLVTGDRACCEGGYCLPFPPRLSGRAPGPEALQGEGPAASGTPALFGEGVLKGLGRRTWSLEQCGDRLLGCGCRQRTAGAGREWGGTSPGDAGKKNTPWRSMGRSRFFQAEAAAKWGDRLGWAGKR